MVKVGPLEDRMVHTNTPFTLQVVYPAIKVLLGGRIAFQDASYLSRFGVSNKYDLHGHYYYYYVFILSAISPYTTGLKALLNPSDCTSTAPTHK